MAERPQQLTNLRRITPEHVELVTRFVQGLPEGDRTFLKEDVDAETVTRWCSDERSPRWLVLGEDGAPQAMLGILPGALWSAHVGELRLVVGEAYRRRGIGRRLARFGLAEALRLGLRKIVVEVVADKEADIAMFTSIGFDAEALLRDHICDRENNLRDLVVLSHEVETRSASIDVLGLENDVETGRPS